MQKNIDIEAFDHEMLMQSASFLKDDFAIAVEEYLEDATSYIAIMRDGFKTDNPKMVARGSHPLKSNSVSFGLIAVSQLAEIINKEAREECLKPLAHEMFPLLQKAFDYAKVKLRDASRKYSNESGI